MNTFYRKLCKGLLLGLGVLISSCEDEEIISGYLAPLDMEQQVNLVYGTQAELDLAGELTKDQHVSFEITFEETEDLKITDDVTLRDVLERSVTFNSGSGKIEIDTKNLYPNAMQSEISGAILPGTYQVTVSAHSSEGFKPVQQTFSLKVLPAKLEIEEVDNTEAIPYAYALYDQGELNYSLKVPDFFTSDMSWELHMNGWPDPNITVRDHRIIVREGAGDEEKKTEWTYDLIPSLKKDGFTVASRQFRVVLLPEMKFFYGAYYSEYDLSVTLNQLYIGLYDAFESNPPVFYPEKYKQSFEILAIEKDGAAFGNEDNIIGINEETGLVTVAHNHVLEQGRYKIRVQANSVTGLVFETELTLIMESVSEDDHHH
ncbi:hypothetical protein ED312_03030 [Sinomicrobium pectinilyticum]|uniref:Uncharacterized protein n=1 Tax=Sinomicrobium pectinilyticum TaxID=1084421 RepID=A0A3N0EYL4_SINP1|nr:hypothetical protein [Sinomicrobium pectinilyticum]RNL92998.1 hypothetical protein ED312_03030 [Sinomicrobium pectinilyticum]